MEYTFELVERAARLCTIRTISYFATATLLVPSVFGEQSVSRCAHSPHHLGTIRKCRSRCQGQAQGVAHDVSRVTPLYNP